MPNTSIYAGIVTMLTAVLVGPVLAQPDTDPPPQRESHAGTQRREPELRERLQRRMAELREEQERLARAMDMLDNGASREDVMRELRVGDMGDAPPEPGRPQERAGRPKPDDGAPEPDRPRRARGGERFASADDPSREQVAAFMRENLPGLAERLERLKEANPEMAARMGTRLTPRIMDIIETREHDPDLARLKLDELQNGVAMVEALGAVRAARDEPERLKAAHGALADRVADQFDIRAKLHRHEIDQLRQRVDRLQAELDQKLGQREEAIRKRLDDMLAGKGRLDLLGEDGPPRRRAPERDGPARDDTGRDRRPERPGDQPPPRP
jgi:hypothetical protein